MSKFSIGGSTLESKMKTLKVPRNGYISIFWGLYSGFKTENTQSAKKWINFNLGAGGYPGVKTENTQSAKKWLNFNFRQVGSLLWSQN